jgi:hypothetical protein
MSGEECMRAMDEGGLQALMEARGRGCRWNDRVAQKAAYRGDIAMLEWMRGEGCPFDLVAISAAYAGKTHVLDWMVERGFEIDPGICENAAAGGSKEGMVWARQHGYSWGLTCGALVKHGYLELLRWARAQGAEWKPGLAVRSGMIVCAGIAAKFGHVDILNYMMSDTDVVLIDHGLAGDAIVDCAIDDDHIHVLRWVLEQGYVFSARTCRHAAKRGNLPILQWLRSIGCAWDGRVRAEAVAHGHHELLAWATVNGCPSL